ncbi:MAG: DNA repair protein RecO [gamma proteobacterium symbiont of Bathyaustriella thionipta]|nr:DNA repair protein RecO [gamma proteobacterium symbiont of Bathyaustriella thionipta]
MTAAYIIHRRAYSNSSLILELFSESHGRLPVMARGGRSATTRGRQSWLPFQFCQVQWSGRGEIKSLRSWETVAEPCVLKADALYCGFYINELIQRLTAREQAQPELFQAYARTVMQLAHKNIELQCILRIFEKQLLQCLGYGLLLTHAADSQQPLEAHASYDYQPELGPIACDATQSVVMRVQGQTLLDLHSEQFSNAESMREARQLMRFLLSSYLGSRPLKSRELFMQKSLGE